jgi:hypothetical protein
VVPESPTAQDLLAEEQQPEDHGLEGKTNEEQPAPSDTEPEKMYRDADEVESFGAESSILAGRLRALLEHLGITTAPRYRIKEVPRRDVVADAAWQTITSWVRSNKSRLQNSVHYLLPYRKKDQFKAYKVKKDIPRWRWYTTRMWRWS